MIDNLQWYSHRFRVMSYREMFFRALEYLHKFILGTYYSLRHKFVANKPIVIHRDSVDLEPFLRYSCFGHHYADGEIDWHLDFVSGKRFPVVQSRRINIRDPRNGQAKVVWELNRQQFLLDYALMYRNLGNQRFIDTLEYFIATWRDQNPYMIGVNWCSNIEVNLRLISWYLVWQVTGLKELSLSSSSVSSFLETTWRPLVSAHCRFSHSFPSKYSSANNHRIAELVGLFTASSYWKQGNYRAWSEESRRELEKEIVLQHSANGINREEASGYIQFVTDLLLLAYTISMRDNSPLSEKFKLTLRQIFFYIYNLVDIAGNPLSYGDSDDGFVFLPERWKGFNNFQSLLTSGAILFRDPVLKSRSAGFDQKNLLLFGSKGRTIFDALPAITVHRETMFYPEEGHFFFRKEFSDKEVVMHFDAAPLGFLSTAAHGHCDALSVTLNLDGQPVLVDPGTYTYHSEKAWRSYFIGTIAHNTVRVDRLDQATNAGPTLWLNHYHCKLIESQKGSEIDFVKATHDGYDRDRVSHTRSVKFDKTTLSFELEDLIEAYDGQNHFVEIPFHLHPKVAVDKRAANQFILKTPGQRLVRITVDDRLKTSKIRGQVEPILGWYSDSFLHKEPTTVIYSSASIAGSVIFKTRIEILG